MNLTRSEPDAVLTRVENRPCIPTIVRPGTETILLVEACNIKIPLYMDVGSTAFGGHFSSPTRTLPGKHIASTKRQE